MKNTFRLIPLALLGLLAMVTSCSNEAEDTTYATGTTPLQIRLGSDTRSDIIESTYLPMKTQYLVLCGDASSEVDFDYGVSTLRTPILLGENEQKVYAIYPATIDRGAWNSKGLSSLTVNPSTDGDVLFGESRQKVNEANPTAVIDMKHAFARIILNITKDEEDTDDYLLLNAYINETYMSGTIDFYKQLVSPSKTNYGRIESEYIKKKLGSSPVRVEMLVVPQSSTTLGLKCDARDMMWCEFPSSKWEMGKKYEYNVKVGGKKQLLKISAAQITNWEEGGTFNSEVAVELPENEGDWVDLGLPSGTLWATSNLGTESATDFGLYFAWGEVQTKQTFTESNCITLSKWLDDIAGNATYDAATYLWGENWRMPTETECKELQNNCTAEWTSIDGVKGVKFTSANGKSLFLPAAGRIEESTVKSVGSLVAYWASTPLSFNASQATCIWASSYSTDYVWLNNRYVGQPIRPVLNKKQ